MGVDVSVIIVSYHCRDEVLACLASLQAATTDCRYETIVLDNASDDGTVEAIGVEFPWAHVIASPTNLGFARAVNDAAQHAEGEYILLLNPDTIVLDGAIEELVRFARMHPEHTCYGGRTLDAEGNLDPRSAWGAPTVWSMATFGLGLTRLAKGSRWFDSESIPGWQRDTARIVDIVTGCFLLMRHDDWETFGGFDPTYFVYGEDADLGLRIRAAGGTSVIDPDAIIVHTVGASSNHQSDKMQLVMQGRATVIRHHWHGWRRRFGIGALQSAAGVRAIGGRLVRRPFGPPDPEARVWGDVWRTRRTWRRGFTAAPASLTS
jgi:GT2 family glycosyltransferase